MKQRIFLAAKTILLLILGMLVYPAFLAARESKVEIRHKIYDNRFIPVMDSQF